MIALIRTELRRHGLLYSQRRCICGQAYEGTDELALLEAHEDHVAACVALSGANALPSPRAVA